MSVWVPPLYHSGVRYDRTTVWDTTPALYARRYGDCKTLAAARIAELRRAGYFAEPTFRWVPRNKKDVDGVRDFHILVQTDGGWEDPSKVLGMLENENEPHWGIEEPMRIQDVGQWIANAARRLRNGMAEGYDDLMAA